MELYSCSSSIGTDGRSLGAISRPVTGAADSRFATMVIFVLGELWRLRVSSREGQVR